MSVGLPPVGKCIYCGSIEDLRDEHIVPFGLHGTRVLPQATCEDCAKITGAFEGYCQGKMFGDFRIALGFRTRKKKNRPSHLTLDATFKDGTKGPLTIPASEYPAHLRLPYPLAPAGIIHGIPPDEAGSPIWLGEWSWCETEKWEKIGAKYGAEKLELHGEINTLKFMRLIAKIAHVRAVRDYGVDGFAHLATPLILGRSKAVEYLIGCDNPPEKTGTDELHVSWSRVTRSGVLIEFVRLFASLGSPVYHVVTGILPGGHIPKAL